RSALADAMGNFGFEGLGACAGTRFTFYDHASTGGDDALYAAVNFPSAPVGAPTRVTVAPTDGYPSWGTVATGDGVFLAAFASSNVSGSNDIQCRRVALDGGLLDAAPLALTLGGNHKTNPQAVFLGGGVFAVVWDDRFDTNQFDLRAALVGVDGGTLMPAFL